MSALQRLKRVNARGSAEESVPLRVTVLVAVMAAVLAVLRQGLDGTTLRLFVLVGIPAGFWFSYRTRYRQGFWLKVALAVGVVVVFVSFLASLQSAATVGLAAAQLPLAELFCWVQLLHSFDVPARRDLLFSLMSSLVLMAVAGVLSVSMDLVPHLLVWGPAAGASLVLAYRSELAEVPGLGPGMAAGRTGVALIRPVAAVAAVVAAVGAGTFAVLPPAGQARGITFPRQLAGSLPVPNPGGLSNPTLGQGDAAGTSSESSASGGRATFGYFGFSESMDTGARGRPDDTLVMRVRSTHPDFWRGQTFDLWDGRRWSISDPRPDVLTGEAPLEVPGAPDDQGTASGPELVQTFYVVRAGPNLVFGARPISTVYFPDRRLFQLSDGTLRTGVSLQGESVYTVVSRRPVVTEAVLRGSDVDSASIPHAITERYTRLPAVPDRVLQLARQVTLGAPTTYDKVRAIEAWLGANTRYSLEVPPLPEDADAVDRFLFVDRVGFCEQIGSSLVVMLRSLGIPARLAVGYTSGERNPFTGLYEVRASDAHSWAEVWFPGVGWQAFDPTASVPLSGDGGPARASSGLLSYLAKRLPPLRAWTVPAASVVGVCATAVAVMTTVVRRRRRRRRRQRSWADRSLARLEALGAAAGLHRRPSETAGEYAATLARRVGDPRLVEVGHVVTRDAFSAQPASEAERDEVEGVLEDIDAERR